MINRYEDKQVSLIWSKTSKYNLWLQIENAYLNSIFAFNEEQKNLIKQDFSNIKIDENSLEEIKEIEIETKHDFISFINWLEPKLNSSYSNKLHFGLTSSDVIDTASVLQCKRTFELTLQNLKNTLTVLENYKDDQEISKIQILSRTHGQAAEIQCVEDIINRWYEQCKRCYFSIKKLNNEFIKGKLSGPSGNNIFVSKNTEIIALDYLGLDKLDYCSQIIPRDIFLDYFYVLLKVALFIEKVSYDIRLYSQSEIGEICEGFAKNQKGSSAMPHKKNPILTENLCGLVRLYKGYMHVAIDNCLTQHERDISHSSSERIIFEDCAHIVNFGISRLNSVLSNLYFNKDKCIENIIKNKEKLESQNILNEKINQGFSRHDAYKISQEKTCLK